MDSYLKGRAKAQRFHAAIPARADAAKPALRQKEPEKEDIVRAEPDPGVADAPEVDLVVRDGVVHRIVIHMKDGTRLELDCTYGDEEE